MSIVSMKVVTESMRTTTVRVTGYQDQNLAGTLEHPYYGGEAAFKNLTQFLLMMEALMDATGYPQATTQTRRFEGVDRLHQQSAVATAAPLNQGQEAIATFKIKVLFRQDATWQGKLLWREGEPAKDFQSVLELVKLIDQLLTAQIAAQNGQTDKTLAG